MACMSAASLQKRFERWKDSTIRINDGMVPARDSFTESVAESNLYICSLRTIILCSTTVITRVATSTARKPCGRKDFHGKGKADSEPAMMIFEARIAMNSSIKLKEQFKLENRSISKYYIACHVRLHKIDDLHESTAAGLLEFVAMPRFSPRYFAFRPSNIYIAPSNKAPSAIASRAGGKRGRRQMVGRNEIFRFRVVSQDQKKTMILLDIEQHVLIGIRCPIMDDAGTYIIKSENYHRLCQQQDPRDIVGLINIREISLENELRAHFATIT